MARARGGKPVISVIVYGRNDAHGYNLHRRVALSLNCLAEVLTNPDDEIVFVDYNTPDELPTLVEALSDTLTDRCMGRLRVLRVRPAIHNRFAARTHLSVAEPVARNAAARRANPSNRWLLSTNTDMIFVPLRDESLSAICSELPDGFYGLPRYELPEWLWERVPRTEPSHAMAEIARLGPGLRLDELTVSHEWIRFDAPGDFQLILRDDFSAVDGFDEEMLLGYHVDSNLSKRMLLHRGSIESLGDRLAGYHCNHNRTPTVYHGAQRVANDLERFFFSVDRAELPEQRPSWGLADAELEEVPLRQRGGIDFATTVMEAIPTGPPCRPSDAYGAPFALTYDSGHVLPFVADSLAVTPSSASIAYIGANPVLERMLATLVARLAFTGSFIVVDPANVQLVSDAAETADVFVVDLGLDASLVDASFMTDRSDEAVQLRTRLDRTFLALHQLVELERIRLRRGEHPRRIVLVNSASEFWNAYVLAELDCSYTTIHSRVRRATVKLIADETNVPSLLSSLAGDVVLAPLESAVVVNPMEGAIIDVYRRRASFRTIVNSLVRVGTLVTRAARLGRPAADRVATSAPIMVASSEDTGALLPMEGAIIEVYRRRRVFRAIVNALIRLGAATTRATRLGRPPRRLNDRGTSA